MFNPKIISVLAPLSTILAVVVLVHHRGEPIRTGQANRYAANYRDSARIASGSSPRRQSRHR